MSRKLRVGVVFGGRSGEHEISLLSARSVLDALDRDRYEPVLLGIDHEGRWHLQESARTLLDAPGSPLRLDPEAPGVTLSPGGGELVPVGRDEVRGAIDVVFPVLHGTYGEDGAIQGFFDMADLPYVGSGVLGSAVGMDKDIAKKLLRAEGVPVVEWFTLRAGDRAALAHERVTAQWGYPVFVKPANMGSSVGVSKVRDATELSAALELAFRFDRKVLIERGLRVREVEVAVLGNDSPEASVAGEIAPTHEFYSYEAKYLDAEGARMKIPAELDDAAMTALREMAVRTFRALELSGLARVDFFIDKDDGAIYVNEVNTLPGFTKISMYPKLWGATGLGYRALIDRLIALALERHAARQALSTRYEGAAAG